jgi:hypothetical protein
MRRKRKGEGKRYKTYRVIVILEKQPIYFLTPLQFLIKLI